MRRLAAGEAFSLACSIARRQLAQPPAGAGASRNVCIRGVREFRIYSGELTTSSRNDETSLRHCAKNAYSSLFCVVVSIECGLVCGGRGQRRGAGSLELPEMCRRKQFTPLGVTQFDKGISAK